jgi:hypothetical protein
MGMGDIAGGVYIVGASDNLKKWTPNPNDGGTQ